MTHKEKIEYASLAGLVVATGAVLYFFLFRPQQAPQQLTVIQPLSSSGSAVVPGATPAPVSVPGGSLLPNGTQLQTSILTDPHFTSLVPPVYPKVTRDEVGNPDPFAQQAQSQPAGQAAAGQVPAPAQ